MKQGRTLVEIAKELERQVQSKRDFIAPSKELAVVVADDPAARPNVEAGEKGSVLELQVNGYGRFGIGETAHSQLAQRLGIPQNYYDRMRSTAPDLLTRNANHWLHAEPEARMVRTLDNKARAFLSRRFRPLDNVDLAETVLPIIQQNGCRIESAELTESRMYIKAVTEKITFEVKRGDVVQAGIVISNSEIGLGSVKVEPMIFRLVCLNGMIAADYGLNKYHVGRSGGAGDMAEEFFRDETRKADDKAFWMKVRDVVAGSFQKAIFGKIAERLTLAASEKVEGDPVKAVEVVQKRFGLTDGERGGVLVHLIQGGDLSRYGMVNAITRTSQDSKDYDRATDLEKLGGSVLELPKRDWDAIALAE